MIRIFNRIMLAILLVFSFGTVLAQNEYTQVYIPTSFSSIGDGVNPYQVSTSLQQAFLDKGIKTTFNKESNAANYCNQLQVAIEKSNSLLRCKINLQLVDCLGQIVWQQEGVGQSKGFVEGYAEAIADALKDLNKLPVSTVKTIKKEASNAVTTQVIDKVIYYNDKYLFELKENDKKLDLIILNSEKLSYQKNQVVATLEPSDMENLYEVKFTMPDGTVWLGMAIQNNDELTLSITDRNEKQKIVLNKQ